jgi:Na+-driven multidrug efflux pump
MYMTEWMACEGLILMSGLIGVAELSTMGIILVLIPLLECFSFGMQFTITIYVGNSIGEGAVEKAHTFAKAGFAMVCFSTTIVALMIILTRHNLILFFTKDPAVVTLYASAMIILAI